jgi:hypothetical protein
MFIVANLLFAVAQVLDYLLWGLYLDLDRSVGDFAVARRREHSGSPFSL